MIYWLPERTCGEFEVAVDVEVHVDFHILKFRILTDTLQSENETRVGRVSSQCCGLGFEFKTHTMFTYPQ